MSIKGVVVYDPPMCCSTGVCGQTVDQNLLRFSADLEWIQKNGANVRRFNLAQEPRAFAEDPTVKKALQDMGDKALPLVKVDGDVKSQGRYPSRQELSDWVGLGEADGTADRHLADKPASGQERQAGCCGSAPSGTPSASGKGKSGCC